MYTIASHHARFSHRAAGIHKTAPDILHHMLEMSHAYTPIKGKESNEVCFGNSFHCIT